MGQSKTQVITVTNVGLSTLTVSQVSSPSGFAVSDNSFVLEAGASRRLTITFSPTSDRTYLENLKISSNDPDEALVSIAMTGTGSLPN